MMRQTELEQRTVMIHLLSTIYFDIQWVQDFASVSGFRNVSMVVEYHKIRLYKNLHIFSFSVPCIIEYNIYFCMSLV